MTLDDAATQALAQPWVDMDCRQIGPGRRVGTLTNLGLGPLRLTREVQDAAVHKVGCLKPGICTVSIAEMAGESARYAQFGGEPVSNMVFFLPHNLETDVSVHRGMRTVYVAFDQETLLDRLRALEPERWDSPPKALFAVETPRRAALAGAIGSLFAQFRLSSRPGPDPSGRDLDRMTGMLTDIAAFALTEAGTHADDRIRGATALTPDRTLRLMRAAYAYTRETTAQGHLPSVADMCARVGASERSLQQAFRSHLSLSPSTYLRMARLNRVRSSLLAPAEQNASVTDIAMHWGFFHLGRFAAEYRTMFGERPSQTLARVSGEDAAKP